MYLTNLCYVHLRFKHAIWIHISVRTSRWEVSCSMLVRDMGVD